MAQGNKIVFNVTCPSCRHSMKYMPVKKPGIKRCVYCGKSINTARMLR